jgi:hypothetical protein
MTEDKKLGKLLSRSVVREETICERRTCKYNIKMELKIGILRSVPEILCYST